jgi:cytoskeletal protein CcmA (bactofilin family)
LKITGNLDAEGEIQIECEVQGDIHATRIMACEQGNITDKVIANDGNIFHKLLAIEQGAYFEGRERHFEDPMAIQQTADELRPGA